VPIETRRVAKSVVGARGGGCTDVERPSDDPITIQNYEELESTLRDLRQSGVKNLSVPVASLFMVKHVRTFERIGLSGNSHRCRKKHLL